MMIQFIEKIDDGAVRFDDLAEKFKAKLDDTSPWTIEAWITFLANVDRYTSHFVFLMHIARV